MVLGQGDQSLMFRSTTHKYHQFHSARVGFIFSFYFSHKRRLNEFKGVFNYRVSKFPPPKLADVILEQSQKITKFTIEQSNLLL